MHPISCSSAYAWEIYATYPGDSSSVCDDVAGAQLAYIQEELIDGAVVWSYTDCIGAPQ